MNIMKYFCYFFIQGNKSIGTLKQFLKFLLDISTRHEGIIWLYWTGLEYISRTVRKHLKSPEQTDIPIDRSGGR